MLLISVIGSLSLCLASQGPFIPEEYTEGSRIEVGSRPLSEEKQAYLEKERQAEFEAEQQGLIIEPAVSDCQNPQFVLANYQHHRPHYYHRFNSLTNYGECLEIEDGSNWKVDGNDVHKIQHWKKDERLVITPNHSWFSNYKYCITNQSTGAYIKANILLSPIVGNPFTHWVVAFDKFHGHLFLEDGSSWKISPIDSIAFDDWKINDFIIFGYNDSWFSSHEYILINVNMNSYIQANPF